MMHGQKKHQVTLHYITLRSCDLHRNKFLYNKTN